MRVINDPLVNGDMMLGLGANKGLVGVGIAPIGPSAIATRRLVRHLADFIGMKIRVAGLAVSTRDDQADADAAAAAMTLGDVT